MIKANHPERGQTEFTQKMWDALGSNKQGWVQGVEKPAEIVAFEAKQSYVIDARDAPPPLVIDRPLESNSSLKAQFAEAGKTIKDPNSPPKAKRKSKKK